MTKNQRLRYSANGSSWSMSDVAPTAPDTVQNLRSSNVGDHPDNLTILWDAAPRATKYNVYVGWTGQAAYLDRTITATTFNITSMGDDVNHFWYVEGVNNAGEVSPSWSNILKIRSGHFEQSIAAGTGYVSSGFNSVNRFRQGTWGYGSSNQPYFGWYDTEAYRYHAFYEIAPETMWDVVCNSYPSLRPYRNSVGSTGFGWFVTRGSGVGSYSSAITIHLSLANGISYASGAEPGEQGNAVSIGLQGTGSGNVGYSIPGNWPQAIYQYHASYNGLLIRPYYQGGGRVPYGATTAGGSWDLHLSWGKIVTVSQANTSYW